MGKKVVGSRLGRSSQNEKHLSVFPPTSRKGESFAVVRKVLPSVALKGKSDEMVSVRRLAVQVMATEVGRKSSKINLRIDPETQNIIDRAASALGKTRSEFMLESARERAEDVLLDRRVFALNEADWDALTEVLDNPPPPNDALKALLSKTAPWEK